MCCEIMNEITRDTRLLTGILARDVHVSKDGRTIKHLPWIQTNYEMRTTCFCCKHLQNVSVKILFTPSKIHDYSIDNLLTLSSSFAKRVPLRLSTAAHLKPGACFSKVPKLFGRISGDIILFVSSNRRRLEARNFAIISVFIPFTTCEKISFTE